MNPTMRGAMLCALGYGLLLLEGALSTVFATRPFTPNLVAPIILFLAVAPDVSLVRGVVVSFVVGYLLDLLAGNPMGLQTFVHVATFLVARGAGLRLVLRGPAFQAGLSFITMVIIGGAATALRAIFETHLPFAAHTPADSMARIFGVAVSTAVFAPLVFDLANRIESLGASRRDDNVGVI